MLLVPCFHLKCSPMSTYALTYTLGVLGALLHVYGLNLCPSVPKIASMRNSRIMVVIGDAFVSNPIVGI